MRCSVGSQACEPARSRDGAPEGRPTMASFPTQSNGSVQDPLDRRTRRVLASSCMAGPSETQYAQSGDLSIAYQVIGDGALDILFVPGFVSNVELMWDLPGWAHMLKRLSSVGRLIVFDKRGTGCSDRSMGTGSAEDRMDDLRAVADAAEVESAHLVGLSEGGPLAILFATTFPERVRSLVLWGTFARALWAPDYQEGIESAFVDAFIEDIRAK